MKRFQDFLNESTEEKSNDEKEWKLDIFKYLDKRLDIEKSKELKSYIKDFVKNEFEKGQPSWFSVAESILNFARVYYPSCIKNNTFSYGIDESLNFMKKLHKDNYINKVLNKLQEKGVDIYQHMDRLIEWIEDFKEDDYPVKDVVAACMCMFK